MTVGLSRWHIANSSQRYHIWCHRDISKPRQVLTCSGRWGWHGWNASEGVSRLVVLETAWLYNCSSCDETVHMDKSRFKCVMTCSSPSSLLCLDLKLRQERGFTFHSCLLPVSVSGTFEGPQTSPVWIKAINNLLHVFHCSLITVTPFLCSLKLHCSPGFYHPSLPPCLLIPSRSLVVDGEIWRILFSDHTKLSSHMCSFSFPSFS